MKLITVTRLKEFLEKDDTDHDGLLEIYINGVSSVIQKHLNRFLEKSGSPYTYYFEADGNRKRFWLPAYPVDLTEDFTVTIDDDEQEINSDYWVREESGLITFYLAPVFYYPKDIKVVWTGGYELIDDSSDDDGSLDVPDDIKMAAYKQCAYEFKRRNDIGVSAVSLPNGNIQKNARPSKLIQEVRDLLLDYRRFPGAY